MDHEHVLLPVLWNMSTSYCLCYEHVLQPVIRACLMAFAMTEVWTCLTACAMSRFYCLCYEQILLPMLWAGLTAYAMSRFYWCWQWHTVFLCAMSLQLKQPPSHISPLLFFPPSLTIRKVLCLNPYTHFHIVIQPPVNIYYMWSAAPYAREAVKKLFIIGSGNQCVHNH